ncbi:hypothetical protein [Methanoregula sp.]|uniref:hypothetical protein n=1 Tax=Methanoregula sp. TaxID=2052170 RepID=UPI0035692FB4
MTERKATLVFSVAVPLLLVGFLVIPLVIYGSGTTSLDIPDLPGQPAHDGHAANVTRWMQEHSGQEVSAGEYLDMTNPGYLASRPQEAREAYYRMKTRVPNLSSPDPGEYDRSYGDMQYGQRSVAIAIAGFRDVPEDPQVAFLKNYTGQCIMNESMVAVSNRLADRNVSAGTYLEMVCPDFFSGLTESQKSVLDNQSLTVSKIPDPQDLSAFVPPRSVSVMKMTPLPGWVTVVIYGIAGLVILSVGYVGVRRYWK